MEMKAEQHIAANQEEVWAALNDTGILKAAMPGCESFEEVAENTFLAKITAKVGPVKAKFTFNVSMSQIDPPNGYTLTGDGQGGAAGFASGSAVVTLQADGDNTVLSYRVKANVGGKLAQLGSRLIDGSAKKMADDFFGNFNEILSGESHKPAADDLPVADKSKALPTWVWIAALLVVAALGWRVFA